MIYGKTNQQKAHDYLKWSNEYHNTWYRWFAWRPVELEDGRKTWWTHVYRNRERWSHHFGWRWVYKLRKPKDD